MENKPNFRLHTLQTTFTDTWQASHCHCFVSKTCLLYTAHTGCIYNACTNFKRDFFTSKQRKKFI